MFPFTFLWGNGLQGMALFKKWHKGPQPSFTEYTSSLSFGAFCNDAATLRFAKIEHVFDAHSAIIKKRKMHEIFNLNLSNNPKSFCDALVKPVRKN